MNAMFILVQIGNETRLKSHHYYSEKDKEKITKRLIDIILENCIKNIKLVDNEISLLDDIGFDGFVKNVTHDEHTGIIPLIDVDKIVDISTKLNIYPKVFLFSSDTVCRTGYVRQDLLRIRNDYLRMYQNIETMGLKRLGFNWIEVKAYNDQLEDTMYTAIHQKSVFLRRNNDSENLLVEPFLYSQKNQNLLNKAMYGKNYYWEKVTKYEETI